jgi:hypothetical protein
MSEEHQLPSGLTPALLHARRRSSTAPPPQWGNQQILPKVAFITGASSGLGLALVKAFSDANYKARYSINYFNFAIRFLRSIYSH